jgi:hypothetical protein
MLTYKAGYKFVEGRVFAQVLDNPGALTEDATLESTRRMLASALLDISYSYIECGQPLPLPDATASEEDFDIVEPIHLVLQASTQVQVVASGVVVS